jgi:FlaA1/EpsC-like NDP-sugar epimerase
MGQPVKIVDLARDLIRLSGLAEESVPIVYTGLRAGERLHEALFHDHETTEQTGHASIMRVRGNAVGAVGEPLNTFLAELEPAVRRHDDDNVRDLLRTVANLSRPDSGKPSPVSEVDA